MWWGKLSVGDFEVPESSGQTMAGFQWTPNPQEPGLEVSNTNSGVLLVFHVGGHRPL